MNTNELVDIRTISVDKELPQPERGIEYVRQIVNPYLFKCGGFIITAIYPSDAPPMNDCLRDAAT